MDQTVAMDLVKKGSTLLLLDVPQGTLVGLDTQVGVSPCEYVTVWIVNLNNN